MLCLLSQTRLKNTDYHRAMSTTLSDKTKEHTVPSCSVFTVSHMTKEHRVSDMTENHISCSVYYLRHDYGIIVQCLQSQT